MSRGSYHHGDLRNALIQAGARLAEAGGPEEVGVRAAARQVGVTPTAAYRHFVDASHLRSAVKDFAFQAMAVAVRDAVANAGGAAGGTAGEAAMGRLAALGRAYVAFALAEPGLFRTAFGPGGGVIAEDHPLPADSPFALLTEILDDLARAGMLPAERRPMAELAAWSAVHGLARLVLDGPLAALPEPAREAAVQRTLDMLVRGL